MALLEMREASFARDGETIAGPITLDLDDGTRLALTFATRREADAVALLASACARATSGTLFIGGYDPRIQPAQSKRIVGYVPHDVTAPSFASFQEYVRYRAALWGLAVAPAIERGRELLARLRGVHEATAYPLAGALLARPRLLVLQRPPAAYAQAILAVADACAVLTTHADATEAAAFA